MYRNTLVFCALLCVALGLGQTHATELGEKAFGLEDLQTELEQENPLLKSRRAEVLAARERPAQASAGSDPMLAIELWQTPLDLQRVPLMFTVQQPIFWPGKRRARAQAVEPEAAYAQAESAATRRSLRLEAAQAYYDYWLALRTKDVLQDMYSLLEVILASVDARYRAGRGELLEVLAAQQSRGNLSDRLLDVRRDLQAARNRINVLLARPTAAPLGRPLDEPAETPLLDEETLLTRALLQRPELQAGQALLQAAQARIKAAKLERAPDFSVWAGIMAMLRGGGEATFSLGVQSSIPSFSLFKYAAAEREALALQSKQREVLRQTAAQIGGEVAAARLQAATAKEHIRLYRESLLPIAQRTVQAAKSGHQTGQNSLGVLLEAARALLELRLKLERYRADYGQSLAALEAAIGGPLPSRADAQGGR